MKPTHKQGPTKPGAGGIPEIAIIHEDSMSGIRAIDVLERVATRLATRLGLSINPWRFHTYAWKFDENTPWPVS